MPKFYMVFARKKYLRFFGGEVGQLSPPPSPTPRPMMMMMIIIIIVVVVIIIIIIIFIPSVVKIPRVKNKVKNSVWS